ncbi:hypothetical protein FQN57_001006 [Myotisia sp. PD_48]|nr:hypothetical protein FQN57_001006 [Myotisia sp. PD_48]
MHTRSYLRVPYSPPLLPSSSLEGLEQVVPREEDSSWNLIPTWKLNKPLPDTPVVPRRSSSVYSTDDNYLKQTRYDSGFESPCTSQFYSKRATPRYHCSVDELRIHYDRGFQSRSTPRQLSLPGAIPILVPRDPRFHATQPPESPVIPVSQARDSRSNRASDPTTNTPAETIQPLNTKLEGPSVPSRVNQGNAYPSPVSENDHGNKEPVDNANPPEDKTNQTQRSDLCFCHQPHPCHSKIILSPQWLNGSDQDKLERMSSISTLDQGHPMQTQTGREIVPKQSQIAIGEEITRLEEDRRPPRTQLYSFSTCDDDGLEIDDRHENIPMSPYPSPGTRPQRTKQLAIPPSDYQLYGSNIWSKKKPTSKRSLKISQYVSKVIPKAFRRNRSKNQCRTMTTAISPPYIPEEPLKVEEEWRQLRSNNKRAWYSTADFSRERTGSNHWEEKRREELKSRIVMVQRATTLQTTNDQVVRWL